MWRLLRDEFVANHPFIFTPRIWKRPVLAMMNARRGQDRRRYVVRFSATPILRRAGVAAVDADEHGDAEDVDGLAAVELGTLDWIPYKTELSEASAPASFCVATAALRWAGESG